MIWSIQVTGFSQWTCLNPVPTCEYLGKSYFVNENTGYILGDNGTLVKTMDGGATWTVKDLGLTGDMNSIFFTDELSGIMVGYLGTILKRKTEEITWQDVSTYIPNPERCLFSFSRISGTLSGLRAISSKLQTEGIPGHTVLL